MIPSVDHAGLFLFSKTQGWLLININCTLFTGLFHFLKLPFRQLCLSQCIYGAPTVCLESPVCARARLTWRMFGLYKINQCNIKLSNGYCPPVLVFSTFNLIISFLPEDAQIRDRTTSFVAFTLHDKETPEGTLLSGLPCLLRPGLFSLEVSPFLSNINVILTLWITIFSFLFHLW